MIRSRSAESALRGARAAYNLVAWKKKVCEIFPKVCHSFTAFVFS